MRYLSPICAVLPLLIAAAPLHAQEVAAPPSFATSIPAESPVVDEPEVALDELVRRALENNPQLPIARQTQEAARQRLSALGALPNPTLELVPGMGNRDARDEEVIVSQPLDFFGRRRARAGVAGAELRRAQAETTLAERTLVVQVKNAAADLFAAQEAESLGIVGVQVARLFLQAATRRAQLGDVPPIQAQRAELELLRVQNELTVAQAERLARRAMLNQLINQPPQTPLRVALPLSTDLADLLRLRTSNAPNFVSSVPSIAPLASGGNAGSSVASAGAPVVGSSAQVGSDLVGLRGQVLPGALTNRPDVVGAQATLEARRAQVGVLRRERLPNVELQVRRNAFFGRDGSYALRAVVTLPVFDFGSLKGERRAAEAEVRAQEATIALLRSQVSTQVEQALIRLQQQQQTVERYRTGMVPLSIELLRKSQIGFAAGASTYLEVLEAQRTLRQVQTEYLQALVGTRTSEATLESALGAVPPNGLPGLSNPTGPAALPGTAAPGTIPSDTIPPMMQAPMMQAPLSPPSGTSPAIPVVPTSPGAPATPGAVGTR